MIVVLLIYNALTAFTTYDLVYAMTGGGPGTATTLLSFQIWKESFSMYDFGAGSAVAFIVVAISAVMILAITRALPSDLFEGDEMPAAAIRMTFLFAAMILSSPADRWRFRFMAPRSRSHLCST